MFVASFETELHRLSSTGMCVLGVQLFTVHKCLFLISGWNILRMDLTLHKRLFIITLDEKIVLRKRYCLKVQSK